MSMRSNRLANVIVGALLAGTACARTGNNSADSSTPSATVSAATPDSSGTSGGAASSATGKSGATLPATQAGQRTTDLPARRPDSTPPRHVDNPCGGIHVNVTVRSSALAQQGTNSESALRAVATDLIAGVRDQVVANSLQLSPAIRTFRVTVRDQAAADLVIARLGQAARVEGVEADKCIRRQ